MKYLMRIAALTAVGCALATTAVAEVKQLGAVTVYTAPSRLQTQTGVDFANAKPMPMPMRSGQAASQADALRQAKDPIELFGNPRVSPGEAGTGDENPVQLVAPQDLSDSGVEPDEFGTSGQPFTTNRVNAQGDITSKFYPYRAAGKLFFKIGSGSFVCSASQIKPGVIVTAAHCVANFGHSQFYSNWVFVPAYNNGTAPYGSWNGAQAFVLTSYFNGTDSCAVSGIVCKDDVAVIVEAAQSGAYPGTATGWFGYGVNGYGFNSASQVLIDQLGYPVALDSGRLMQRNDSQGFVSASNSNNTLIGSLMTGGSSGGPWLVNLGIKPALNGTSFGTFAGRNIVVGVTSWGFTDTSVKQQGASPFTSKNISVLVKTACTAVPAAC